MIWGSVLFCRRWLCLVTVHRQNPARASGASPLDAAPDCVPRAVRRLPRIHDGDYDRRDGSGIDAAHAGLRRHLVPLP